jgi:hypothetical protein
MDRGGSCSRKLISVVQSHPEREKRQRRKSAVKLLDQVRNTARVRHLSYRTEQSYVYWIERYIRYHGIRHRHGETGVTALGNA